MSRTKIVCTIGPASAKEAVQKRMVKAGMNVARLNFSHGTHEQHQGFVLSLRRVARELGVPLAIMQDLQGPKIRIGIIPGDALSLRTGDTVHFSPRTKAYAEADRLVPVTYGGFARDVRAGDRVLIDDGLIECSVVRVQNNIVAARVVTGGNVSSNKGINLPDSAVRLSALTAKDQKDVAFGVREEVDFIVLSFVSSAEDIHKLRDLIKREEKRQKKKPLGIQVVAKIERADAIHRMDEIIEASDVIMIGRGDLGVEIPLEEVPIRQKEIAHKSRCAGKPVIVATHMLESMRQNVRATRAEISDVANAVIDHADAVMLSAESASGKFPVKAVETLTKVIEETEKSVYDNVRPDELCVDSTDAAIAKQIHLAFEGGGVDGIVTGTQFGDVAMLINRHRPEVPLFIAANTELERNQLAMKWGARPFMLKKARTTDVFEREARKQLTELKWIKKTDRLLFVTSV
ncbi:pyruvate kinase [Candidatus Uhrbacteria bacterium RIFCSPHIGHO2_02_FULL_53_13]|uniref:Pyruvate kinase n=1 Tax=Candidatus Uhrbacteria bacterium RIFCSPHIGHO2_02_FULL_53_13 TaxID=1802389 RepID=A0A1F7TVE7_9BACT|nr:MAG: pyruvate kinase [Candidatus Uhrbacteria bacterium RIFCSPHIGHO2_02_FULL_53_13]